MPAFALWLTGLPASGKSTVAQAVRAALAARGVEPAVLESDALRPLLTPAPRYDEAERDTFYRALGVLAMTLCESGVPVIVDATANRRAYRDWARAHVPRFLEVHLECPLSVCESRDPKGIYRRAREGQSRTVPGLQAPYEPPLAPELVVDSEREAPEAAAQRIVALLVERGYLARRSPTPPR